MLIFKFLMYFKDTHPNKFQIDMFPSIYGRDHPHISVVSVVHANVISLLCKHTLYVSPL